MSIETKSVCVVCGEEFSYHISKHSRPRIYCGAECRSEKYGRGAISMTAVCRNCGNTFIRRGSSKRVCCSGTCAIDLVRREATERIANGHSGELRGWVVSLCRNGYGIAMVADALGLNHGTVKSWLERAKGKKDTRKNRRRFSFPDAETADEWLAALRLETAEPSAGSGIFGGRTVYLVCGGTNVKRGADQLAAIVQVRLKSDARDGSVYVFCNEECEIVRCLFWDGSGFNVIARRREFGAYPWPSAQVGLVIKATPDDLERILVCERKNGKNPRLTWDNVDVTDLKKHL